MRYQYLLFGAINALAAASVAAADPYPNRPIRMIVANAPGSASDIYGRIVFTRMSERLGQQIVIDNRPGAGGTLGVETSARAVADGYTLITVTAAVMTIAPHVYAKVGFDPLKDFLPVSVFVKTETALCVHAGLPVKTLREFIDLAKSKPGQLNMASAGIGSTSHLGGLMFATLAGIEGNHIPYKGGGPSALALVQGESQWTMGPYGAYGSHVKAGRVRCLATGGDKRSALTPELPTIAEAGVAGFRYYGWNGVLAPRATPRPVVDKLNGVMRDVLGTTCASSTWRRARNPRIRASPISPASSVMILYRWAKWSGSLDSSPSKQHAIHTHAVAPAQRCHRVCLARGQRSGAELSATANRAIARPAASR
jgi:tripartite-type tricarboxylate transporter receptor subunit TctC